MYFKKTMVLSSLDGTADKAVVNVEKFKDRIEGQLRLYNFKQEPSGILTLAILKDGNVYKAGLTQTDSRLYSFVLEDVNLEDASAITCALINFKEGKAKPLLFGSCDGKIPTSSEIRLASTLSLFDDSLEINKVKSKLDEYQIDYEDEEKAEIESLIDQTMKQTEEHDCTNCQYRKAFYSNQEEEQKEQKPRGQFYESIKKQIAELFSSYPEEEYLKQIIPHSKWVKVDYENNGQYYVVGLIYEDGYLKYICYGMPGIWQEKPPKEIEGFSQWLPLDVNDKKGLGYWLTYQDADNGENIIIEMI